MKSIVHCILFCVWGKQNLLILGMLVLWIILWLIYSLPLKDAWYSALASLVQWFSTRLTSSLRGHLAMSGTIFGCHSWRGTTGISWVEARDSAKHPIIHRTTPHNKELSGPRCQQCWHRETLILSHGKLHLARALSVKHIVGTIRLWVAVFIQGVYYGPHVGFKCFLRQAKGPNIEIYENSYCVRKGRFRSKVLYCLKQKTNLTQIRNGWKIWINICPKKIWDGPKVYEKMCNLITH